MLTWKGTSHLRFNFDLERHTTASALSVRPLHFKLDPYGDDGSLNSNQASIGRRNVLNVD